MRSARILLATATATAALVIAAPGAHAVATGSDKDDSSYSSENHGKSDKDWGKDKGGKPHGGMHTGGGALASVTEDHKDWEKDKGGKPHGGMHTGGGALATVTNEDWEKDKGGSGNSETGGQSEKSEGWKGEKPSGGMHTGGGGLASSGSGMAAGSLLLLGGLGAGAYMLRRRNANGTAA